MSALSKPIFLAALAFLSPQLSQAQLLVNIRLDRDSYVTQEPTVATVTVENRAGKDIILGGPEGGSWLLMDVRETIQGQPEGLHISARNGEEPKPSTVLLKNGGSVQRKIDIQAYYAMNSGQYSVNCSVYFAELDRWLGPEKNTNLLLTSPRKPIYEQTVGIGEQVANTSGYRRYKLFTSPSSFVSGLQRTNKNLMYVQICDEGSGDTLHLYPLGELLTYYPPQPTVDAGSNLHVLYQNGPTMWAHAMVSPKGDLRSFVQYEAVPGSKPVLKNDAGSIKVAGGRLYDPKVEALLAVERRKEERTLSDRPEGLPEETVKP